VREFADPPSPTLRRGKQRSEVRSHFEAQQYKTGLLCFQIEIKENKTPGGEHCLDPPGAELLAWPKISQATRAGT
jgi:hypothetical protein